MRSDLGCPHAFRVCHAHVETRSRYHHLNPKRRRHELPRTTRIVLEASPAPSPPPHLVRNTARRNFRELLRTRVSRPRPFPLWKAIKQFTGPVPVYSTAMSMQTAGDIPLSITSDNSSSERRITPSWTIGQLKSKLEAVTGIPPLSQKLTIRVAGQQAVPIEAADEENTQLAAFPLAPYAELHVADVRPPGARANFTDVSAVEKFVLPVEEYEKKSDSVLAWKKAQKLGRFDPNAPSIEHAKIAAFQSEVENRGIEVGRRCRVGGEDTRRGEVMYVGEVPEIPGGLGAWVGIQLDEPMGKNDGSVGAKRYWEGKPKCGVFVRPERVAVGDFPIIDDLDEDMEEI